MHSVIYSCHLLPCKGQAKDRLIIIHYILLSQVLQAQHGSGSDTQLATVIRLILQGAGPVQTPRPTSLDSATYYVPLPDSCHSDRGDHIFASYLPSLLLSSCSLSASLVCLPPRPTPLYGISESLSWHGRPSHISRQIMRLHSFVAFAHFSACNGMCVNHHLSNLTGMLLLLIS